MKYFMDQDREEIEEEEEHVLLDLDSVLADIDIPQNAPYVLSGLDTLNPILIIDNKIKLENNCGRWLVQNACLRRTIIRDAFPLQKYLNELTSIGEYEETIGTCIIISESEVAPTTHEQMGPSETNLLSSKRMMDPKQKPAKQVNPRASLHKVLKFRLFFDADDENGEDKDADTLS